MMVTKCKELDWDTDSLLFSQHTVPISITVLKTSVLKISKEVCRFKLKKFLTSMEFMEKTSKCCLLVTLVILFFGTTWAFNLMLCTCTPITLPPFIFAYDCDHQLWDCSFQYSSTHKICHISLLQNYKHPAFFFARRLFVFSIHSPLWQI